MRKSVNIVIWICAVGSAVAMFVFSCGPECINIIQSDYDEEPTIEGHYIHTASATILALTVFGSVLGIRIVGDSNSVRTQRNGILAIFAGVIAIVTIHVHIMISTCCMISAFTQSNYACLLVLTMLFMFLLMTGFSALVDAQLKAAKHVGTHKHGVDDDQDEYAT